MLSCRSPLKQDETTIFQGPNTLFHPCSGKHLWLKKNLYGGSEDYLSQAVSTPEAVRVFLSKYFGDMNQYLEAKDSCGLPTWAFPFGSYFEAWSRLARDSDFASKSTRLLMTNNPQLLGGSGRLDSELMTICEGGLIAKEGADGLLFLQSLEPFPARLQSFFLKIEGGYDPRSLRLSLYSHLKKHEAKLGHSFKKVFQFLKNYVDHTLPRDIHLAY